MAQLGADPALVAALLANAMRQCRRVEDLFLLRAQQSSYRLLAGFLQKLCALVGLEVDGVLRLPLSRTEIAEHLGFSPETASRAFTRLRELGLLVPVGRRDVRIIDADGLAHLAEWRPNRLH
jgi:CRP-like cAMP-binding protein